MGKRVFYYGTNLVEFHHKHGKAFPHEDSNTPEQISRCLNRQHWRASQRGRVTPVFVVIGRMHAPVAPCFPPAKEGLVECGVGEWK